MGFRPGTGDYLCLDYGCNVTHLISLLTLQVETLKKARPEKKPCLLKTD